jgi:hypothetical protein
VATSEDKLKKVFIRGLLGVDLALAHGTEEFSEHMWGINEPV